MCKVLDALPNQLVRVEYKQKKYRVCTPERFKRLFSKKHSLSCSIPPFLFYVSKETSLTWESSPIIVIDEFCIKQRTLRRALEFVGIRM